MGGVFVRENGTQGLVMACEAGVLRSLRELSLGDSDLPGVASVPGPALTGCWLHMCSLGVGVSASARH